MAASSSKISALIFAVLMPGLAGAPQAAVAGGPTAAASEAFGRYVRLTEGQMAADLAPGGAFLRLDTLQPEIRSRDITRLRSGEVVTERLQTRDGDRDIEAPDALIHHWVGTVFIPNATVGQVLDVVEDYDRHQEYYAPQVVRSKLRSRTGGRLQSLSAPQADRHPQRRLRHRARCPLHARRRNPCL